MAPAQILIDVRDAGERIKQSTHRHIMSQHRFFFSALQSTIDGRKTEFKSVRGGLPDSYCASRTQGGAIVLGLAETPSRLIWGKVTDATTACVFPITIRTNMKYKVLP
jgi:hypothetical protein